MTIARRAILGAAMTFWSGGAVAADLLLRFDGLRSTDGLVSICVWSSALAFPDCGASNPYDERSVKASDLTKPVVFENVPPGALAVTAIHDENGNGHLDTNILGIPREGVAISNNRVPRLRAPRFSDAVFEFDGRSAQTLTMSYW